MLLGICLPAGNSGSSGAWARPSDWISLPSVDATVEKFAGIFAVFDTESEFVAFTATGNYTVDWGDGSATENINSGVTAQHQYTYATISATTLSALGYKQVAITIVPQAGAHLSTVDLNKRHSSASAQVQNTGWLDITCSCYASSTGGLMVGGSALVIRSNILERATIYNGALRTSTAYMFYACSALQSVPLFNTASVTTMAYMFSSCYGLHSVPLFNTASVTTMASMFAACSALQSVPLFNTASVTTMASMFANCYGLHSVPLFNTASVTTMASMFANCYVLQTVPLFNTASVTTMASMFSACFSIKIIEAFVLSSLTTTTSMLNNAISLSKALFTNINVSFSVANLNLSAAALNEIFNNLPTVVGQTITITGCYGAATCDQTIATGKGYTVIN
jgi:surface protein